MGDRKTTLRDLLLRKDLSDNAKVVLIEMVRRPGLRDIHEVADATARSASNVDVAWRALEKAELVFWPQRKDRTKAALRDSPQLFTMLDRVGIDVDLSDAHYVGAAERLTSAIEEMKAEVERLEEIVAHERATLERVRNWRLQAENDLAAFINERPWGDLGHNEEKPKRGWGREAGEAGGS